MDGVLTFTAEERRRYSYYIGIAIRHLERDPGFRQIMFKYGYNPIETLEELELRLTWQTLAPDGRCVSSINVGQVRYWCEAGPEGHDGLCRGSDQWGGRAEWRWSSVASQRPSE